MSKHDKLGKRLGIILTRLNTGERLSICDLAREFGVSERTVQRDFNGRLNYLPIEREGSTYYIDPSLLGRLSNPDIKQMLYNIGITDLVPELASIALSEFSHCAYPPIYFESTTPTTPLTNKHFKLLLSAINRQVSISFNYGNQVIGTINPYQLINQQAQWILVAMLEDKLIAFKLNEITDITLSDSHFAPNTATTKAIKQTLLSLSDTQMSNDIEAIIIIKSPIAHYFKQADLLPNQQILREQGNGDLVISMHLQTPLQLLPQFIYWSPHISIISPSSLQALIDYQVALKNVDLNSTDL